MLFKLNVAFKCVLRSKSALKMDIGIPVQLHGAQQNDCLQSEFVSRGMKARLCVNNVQYYLG